MAKTLREKFIQALTKAGETEVKRTHKFIVFTRQTGGHYYIGASGSLRFGQTVTGSIPVNHTFKQLLLSSVS